MSGHIKYNRKMMQSWYRGGPEIRIPIVGDKPDLSPITLRFAIEGTERTDGPFGFLMSQRATCEQLVQCIAEILEEKTSHFLLKFINPRNRSTVFVRQTQDFIMSKDIFEDATLLVSFVVNAERKRVFRPQYPCEVQRVQQSVAVGETEEDIMDQVMRESERSYAAEEQQRRVGGGTGGTGICQKATNR